MFESYRVGVRLSLIDDVASPMRLLLRHFADAELAAGKLQVRLDKIRGFFVGGTALFGAGAAMAAPLIASIDKAAQLQKQMIAIQLSTRGTTAEMGALRATIEQISGQTIFSAIDVAKMAKQVSTGTGFNAQQLQNVLPAYARYADVQALMKGAPYEQSIGDAIRAAHGAGHFDAKSLTEYLDLINKASLIIPGSTAEIAKGLAYFQTVSKNELGLSDNDSILAVALANRLGMHGTRGGTTLTAALTRSVPGVFGSGLLTGKSGESLKDMGMVDAHGRAKVFKDGKFDMLTWMGLTADYVAREFASNPENEARQHILQHFQRAYGTQGSRLASLLGTPQAITSWKELGAQFGQYGGFEAMQETFANQSVAQQWMNTKADFSNALTEVGMTLLPTASKALQTLNGYLKDFVAWTTKNPEKVGEYAKNIGLFAVAIAGLGVVSIATSAITGLVTVLGLMQASAITTSATMGELAGAIGYAGAAGKAKILLDAGTKLGLAGAVGYGIGSLLYHFTPENIQDAIGRTIARGFALFDQDDRDVLDTEKSYMAKRPSDRWTYAGRSPAAKAPYLPAQRQNPLVINTRIDLDGRKIAESVTRHQGDAANGPQRGLSGFDSSRALLPAGGAGIF